MAHRLIIRPHEGAVYRPTVPSCGTDDMGERLPCAVPLWPYACASRRSPMAFRCVAISDSSVLTAHTALWVYRFWISTISMGISSVLPPRSTHFNCNSSPCAAWNAWSTTFSWLAVVGVVGPTGQSSYPAPV